jgi:hypothetical protein
MCTGHDHGDDVDVLRPFRDELSTGPKGNSARLHSGLGTWHGLVCNSIRKGQKSCQLSKPIEPVTACLKGREMKEDDDSDDRNEQPMPAKLRHHSPQENSAVRHRGVAAGKPVAERSAQQLGKFFSFLSKQDPGSWRWQVGSVFTYVHAKNMGCLCLLETAFRNSGDISHVTARRVAICGPC